MSFLQRLDDEHYLAERVDQYRSWYDRKARRCKLYHLGLRVAALVLSFTSSLFLVAPDIPRLVPAVLVTSVFVALGLDIVLRLEAQWENYRYTEQYLDRERYLFLARAGRYSRGPDDAAFRLLVERVEWAIAAENSTTMSTLALSPDAGVVRGSEHDQF